MASGKKSKTNVADIVSLFITKRGAALFGTITVIIGSLGMVGWIPGMQFLGRIRPDFIPMAPSTAVSFILVGLIQALHSRWDWKSGGKAIVILIVVLVSTFGLLEVVELFTGISLNFEDVIIPEKGTLAGVPIARMSPSTGGAFLIAGLSMLLYFIYSWDERRSSLPGNLAGALGTFVFIIALTYQLSYLLGIPFLYTTGIIPMAVTTASGFFFLGLSLIFNSGTQSFPGKWVSGNTTRARLLRVFLPLTILLVLLEALLYRFEIFLDINDALLVSIIVVVSLVFISFVISQVVKSFGETIDKSVVALRLEQEIAQRYLDVAGVALVALNKKGKITLINKKGNRILGYQEDELIGKNWFDTCLPEQNRKEVKGAFKKIMVGEGELVEYYENLILAKSGEERIIAWHNTVLRDEKGHNIGTLSSGEDITERKQAEEEIKSLSKFPDENPNPILRFSKSGQILYASKSSALLLNKWGRVVGEKVPPDWKKSIANSFISDENLEFEELCDGRILSFILAPIKEMGYINAYGRDITERKQAEERLKERAQELEQFNHLSVGRELRMVELKKEVNQLSTELGKEPHYDTSFAEDS